MPTYKAQRTVAKKEAVTDQLSLQGSTHRDQPNMSISQSFPEWVEIHTLKAAAWGSGFKFSKQLGADYNPSQRPGKPANTSSTLSLQPVPNINLDYKYLPRRTLHTPLLSHLLCWHPRYKLPDCLVLIANKACTHETHRTVAKKQFLMRTKVPHTPMAIYLGPSQREQAKMSTSQFLPERANYILS